MINSINVSTHTRARATRISAEEAASALGVSRQTIYAYVSRGLVRAFADPTSPKRSLYDARDVKAPTQNTDLLPTLCELCGVAPPRSDKADELFSGISLAALLRGKLYDDMAVVKAQVDFITKKVPNAEIHIHPHSGEAGAIGAALCALEAWSEGRRSRFRGFETIKLLNYRSTTSDATVCKWCPVNCKRAFIDVELVGAKGRPWSKLPLEAGWERVISGNSCPKGLVEDAAEMRVVKAEMEEQRRVYPNIGATVRDHAFRSAWDRA